LAQKACRDGHLVFYTRAAALFRDLAVARADGSLRNLLGSPGPRGCAGGGRLGHGTVLEDTKRRNFWEICEERYQTRSTILTSQVPVAQWHEQIGDATIADGILDRLVHNAHRIELRGESMRKSRSKKSASASPPTA